MSTPEVLRTPEERFANLAGYSFAPHYVNVDGLRLHYPDEGPRSGRPVVCFHGEPIWVYLYRTVIVPLVAAGRRVVAVDYAGFGRSDKPTDRRWCSYDRHVALVTAVLGHLNLQRATVVVQDWGGPIGLRWATENDDVVADLAILNTGLFTGRVSKGFLGWRAYAEKTPDLPVATWFRAQRSTLCRQRWLPPTTRPSPQRSPRQALHSFSRQKMPAAEIVARRVAATFAHDKGGCNLSSHFGGQLANVWPFEMRSGHFV
jgi:pimeloyl-ACP methyl ester carboxylesterase